MRIVQLPDGTWAIVRDSGQQIGPFASAAEASSAADALVASAAAAPAAPSLATGPEGTADQAALVAALASDLFPAPTRPADAWFDPPAFTASSTVPAPGCTDVRGCPLTVTDEGQVFGHLGLWGTCHTGFPGECVPMPRSQGQYRDFRTGAVVAASGATIATGPLTVGTGHADLHLDARAALAHYDNSGTAVADVAVGEDEYGVWVAGAVRPGATVAQVEALRRSPLSGDWRDVNGRPRELIAALAVNSPGFTVHRNLVAAFTPRGHVDPDDGHVTALVAAGAAPLAAIMAAPWTGPVELLQQRVHDLEQLVELLRPQALTAALAKLPEPVGV